MDWRLPQWPDLELLWARLWEWRWWLVFAAILAAGIVVRFHLLEQGSEGDRVVVTYSGSPPSQTWVLLDGQTAEGCKSYLKRNASVADFQVPNLWPDVSCTTEVAVFDSAHAVVLDVNPPLTTGVDIVTESPGPPLPLELNLWVVSDAPAADVWNVLKTAVEETQDRLDSNRVGVELRLPSLDGTWQPVASWSSYPANRLVPRSDTRAATIGNYCTQSQVDVLHAAPSLPAPPLYDAGRLNLYVVEDVNGSTSVHEDLCAFDVSTQLQIAGGDNVIYFSRLHHMNASLAHVLGHAFSLIDKGNAVRADGHTGFGYYSGNPCTLPTGLCPLDGFTYENIMWTSLNMTQTEPRKTFSLGQVYRMTLDKNSWLNKTGTKVCPESPDGDVACPPLAYSW